MSNDDSGSDSVPTLYQGAHFLSLLKEKKVTRQKLDELVKSGLLSDLLEADVTHVDRARFWEALDGEYTLLVNETQTLWSLVERSNYDWVNPYITKESLTLQGCDASPRMYTQPVRFLRHGGLTGGAEMLAQTRERAFRPCTMRELLTFGVHFPRVSWEAPVVALGSTFDLNNVSNWMGICGEPHERRLRLYPESAQFPLRTRFLSVKLVP